MDVVRFSALPRRLLPVVLAALAMTFARSATATDYGAQSNGTWSNAAIWTPAGGPPGTSDQALVGSTYPGGAAATASVSLGGDQSVNYLYLGYGAATSGTLNLAGHALTVNSTIYLGTSGGSAAIVHNGGTFSTYYLNLDAGNSFTFAAGDTSNGLSITDTSQVTTAGVSNVGVSVGVDLGSSLTLGAAMTLDSSYLGVLDVESNSTLNMAGHPVSANTVALAWNSGNPESALQRAQSRADHGHLPQRRRRHLQSHRVGQRDEF